MVRVPHQMLPPAFVGPACRGAELPNLFRRHHDDITSALERYLTPERAVQWSRRTAPDGELYSLRFDAGVAHNVHREPATSTDRFVDCDVQRDAALLSIFQVGGNRTFETPSRN